jgi:hypothetical protein
MRVAGNGGSTGPAADPLEALMLVRGRSTLALCLSVISFLFTPAIAKYQHAEPQLASRSIASRTVVPAPVVTGFSQTLTVRGAGALTCDRRTLDAESYEMATIGEARTLLSDRTDFWDAFRINDHITTLRDLNLDVREMAERALERDRRNMMAQSILARQYTILGWERPAADAWTRVVDAGGVVVWTATLYDVDYKSYFLMAFGRDAVRIYRMGQFTGPIERHLGYATFPPATDVAFYEAAGGCPDPSIAPVATIPWSDVRELRSGNWVLWFKLTKPVAVSSDRGSTKRLREIKVNLHGETGEVKILAEPNPEFDPDRDEQGEAYRNVRGIGLGPWDYNRRMRDMILRFAEPAAHIKRTSAGRGAGW